MRSLTILGLMISWASSLHASPATRATIHYLDGASPREVIRGALREDGRRAVTLLHPRSGKPIAATLGDEALVELAEGVSADQLRALGLTPVAAIAPSLHIWQVRKSGEDGLDIAARLARHPSPLIRAAVPDLALPHVHASTAFTPPPDDPRYPGQWFFARIGMNETWARETGSPQTTVVVIDNGCDLAHPDLKEQLDPGYDAFSDDDDPSYELDPGGADNHGTACAGLVAARTNNDLGVAGACPGCRVRCVRLLGKDGDPIPLSADLRAFQFALDHDAAVVSNSWGYKDEVAVPDMIRAILEKLYDEGRSGKGSVVVFAAGNDDRPLFDDEINAVRGVVTVGAVNNFSELTAYSNFGPSIDLVAPTGTLTTDISGPDGSDPTDYTSSFSGTSSACPIVAGVVGLLASAAPQRTAAELVTALLQSARQSSFATPDATGHDDYYGRGEVRPLDALKLLAGEVLDAGVDGASDAGTMKMDEGCGCALGARPREDRAWLWVSAVLLGLLIRRRARACSRA